MVRLGLIDLLHWHGQFVPTDVDGALEEGTPPNAFAGSPPALDRRRIAAPRLRTRHRGKVRLAHWSSDRIRIRSPSS